MRHHAEVPAFTPGGPTFAHQLDRPGGEVVAGYGIGNRGLENAHCRKPVGGEIEAGYGIGSRIIPDNHFKQPIGGELQAGYGIGGRVLANAHMCTTGGALPSLIADLHHPPAARCHRYPATPSVFGRRAHISNWRG